MCIYDEFVSPSLCPVIFLNIVSQNVGNNMYFVYVKDVLTYVALDG